ncbi:uncharacterized protein LOC133847353 [Drosophila sulfurigaster albostrigata]|uniref:uncharacterized protein LOC133847353 n=1 Tax=Drosophila sulfurigaster albostrigata TaxID=89887 RepID=UPI002D21B3F8|nr:uncharacterized protein LOC133847353 [Drosophila sulfurigaster albostrigata]XP_062138314.1 uncharacterized protein LOC133847353 [Drosophila sulfurigaster albostrigata]XP_062138315.1 uncharacterized protein LOC133847353 [Drosophila sulfurigaster albostrigata]
MRLPLLTLLLTQLTVLLLLLTEATVGNTHPDWIQNCSNCHCHWNSGKKTADCKGKKLIKIPQNMSNEMQVIDFSHNQMAELRNEEFQLAGLQNLHKLYLRNCTIQEVNRDAFRGLTILIELDMSNNHIRELHPNTFKSLDKLRNVIINNNEIEVLESGLFTKLHFLSRVEFNNNRLKQVQLNVFGRLDLLKSISLESNKLTHLSKETFADLPKLNYLSLQGNAWNCSCELQEFRDFTIANRLYTPPTDCHDPPQLRGKLWSEVPSENFACRPRLLGEVLNHVESNRGNITLPCQFMGSPLPNVTWIYNKRQLNPSHNDPHVRINTNEVQSTVQQKLTKIVVSELHIYNVRSSDKGIYMCVADNRGGKADGEFHLMINGDHMAITGNSDGLSLGMSGAIGASTSDQQTSIFLFICVIATTVLVVLIFLVLGLFWYCRHIKTYQKDNTIGDGLISCKLDKTHNSSMLEGSVIMEMQKSLLNEVNPVEKPPRRTDIESVDGGDDGHEIKKTLLDETAYANHSRDDETHSVALSDTTTTPRSRHTYVDDTYGNSLPPDLLAFPARVPPTSPSMQSSQSNIPDQVLYGIRSPPPLTSPVYAHMTPHGIYGTTTIAAATHNGFMTLQHPKSRNLALIATANSRHQLQQQQQQQAQQQQQQLLHQHQQSAAAAASPFLPAPVVYSPATAVVMKQGYMTIPRKPRVPSWAPSTSGAAAAAAAAASHAAATQLSEFQSPTSPNPSETGTATTAELQAEPVYDNLGLRTTAGGNSTLNLHKAQSTQGVATASPQQQQQQQQQYTMRDRPLPATPSLTSVASAANASKIYEPIHELIQQQQAMQAQQQQLQQQQQQQQQQQLYNSETEPLYGARHHGITILPGSSISGAGLGSPSSASVVSGALGGSPTHGAQGADSPKIAKIPPRPPPKPKKKMSVTATRSGQGSTSQLFDDEGEDGTEV